MNQFEPIQPKVPLDVDVAIIGAGLGGLAAALALHKAGIDAHVYERTQKLSVVGGAVVIREKSADLFESWGVAERFYKEAVKFDEIEIRDPAGKPTATRSARAMEEGNTYSVHRADVQALLMSGIDPQFVHLGMESAEVLEEGNRGVVRFADGRELRAKVLVGADGIRSVTRKFIHDDEMIFSKLVAMRGLAPASALPPNTPNDRLYSWGNGEKMMLLLPLKSGREVAMDSAMPQDTPPTDLWNSEVPTSRLLEFFKDFSPALLDLIKAGIVPVRANPVYEREPIEVWSTDHVTLLGDAAHAMAPGMGQGANQAIQDAEALARFLGGGGMRDIPGALRKYETERAPITKKIQIGSRIPKNLMDVNKGARPM